MDEIREELSLRYERLSLVAEETNEIELMEDKALFTTQFKGDCRNCGKMGHKAIDCEARCDQQQRVETQVICNNCKKPGNYKAEYSKLLKKSQTLGNSNQRNGMARATTDIGLDAVKLHASFKNIWIGDSEASCHYCNSDEGLFDQATISRMIAVGSGSTMKAEKGVKLRSSVLQCNGRKFEIILENVKFVPEL
jgi:RNase P subunit RPR2